MLDSDLLCAGQRKLDKGTRGLAETRKGCRLAQRRSGSRGAEAASVPLPEVSAPLPGEFTP
ncbi:Hypothetical predicted protein [Marmota monax]|uniref:Uncharacterized protein n=1 Tax=Marmota monax TaxID=9995 RepID=A0A5E4C2Y7_MARMO|nr:hypothetical protein GHT09_012197 [Marmota monax]VTJ76253.1 Hypothetical predicted protein [Marmota monax]